jgi:hypothetical protein
MGYIVIDCVNLSIYIEVSSPELPVQVIDPPYRINISGLSLKHLFCWQGRVPQQHL